MFVTSIPRTTSYALCSDDAESVFILTHAEARRISDQPFRAWYELTQGEQRRIRAAADDHAAIDAEYRARLAAGADYAAGSEIIGARVLAAAAKI